MVLGTIISYLAWLSCTSQHMARSPGPCCVDQFPVPRLSAQQLHVIADKAQRKVFALHKGLWVVLVKPLVEPGSLSASPLPGWQPASYLPLYPGGLSTGSTSGRCGCKRHHHISISTGFLLLADVQARDHPLARCDIKNQENAEEILLAEQCEMI